MDLFCRARSVFTPTPRFHRAPIADSWCVPRNLPTVFNSIAALRALNGFVQHTLGFLGISPASDSDPFVRLEILVVSEEVLDLLHHDVRQVLVARDLDFRTVYELHAAAAGP